MSRTITSLSAVIALPSINRNVQKNLCLALDTQLERVRFMIRRMEPILLAQLNVKTIRHKIRILHPPGELEFTTAELIGNEFAAPDSIQETPILLPDGLCTSTKLGNFLDPNIEVLFLIPHPEVSCSTLIREVSKGDLQNLSNEQFLLQGQAHAWYPKCRGGEYFTWNGQPPT